MLFQAYWKICCCLNVMLLRLGLMKDQRLHFAKEQGLYNFYMQQLGCHKKNGENELVEIRSSVKSLTSI